MAKRIPNVAAEDKDTHIDNRLVCNTTTVMRVVSFNQFGYEVFFVTFEAGL
jgi:hypothetical protein